MKGKIILVLTALLLAGCTRAEITSDTAGDLLSPLETQEENTASTSLETMQETDMETAETIDSDMETAETTVPETTDDDGFAALTALLDMTVEEIRGKYGEFTLEYSEHGPGQPVYSLEKYEGIYLVFTRWYMDDPLEDAMQPSEILVLESYPNPVLRLTPGMDVSEADPGWTSAEYSVINGTITVGTSQEGYTLSAVISGEGMEIPDEVTATTEDWEKWETEFLAEPRGKILNIRIGREEEPEQTPAADLTVAAESERSKSVTVT